MRAPLKWTLVVAVAVVTAACGDSKSSFLPTAPSAVALSADATSAAAGTAAAGNSAMGNGNGNGNGGNGNGNGNGNTPVTTETTKVEFEGLIADVGNGSITVNGQVIYVSGTTVIRHGDRLLPPSELCRNDRVHVNADRVGTTVTATEIKLQNPGNPRNCAVAPPPPPPPPDPDQVVSVTAPDPSAMEPTPTTAGDNGMFQLTRTGTSAQLANPLTVSFTLSGTATNGSDYAALSSPVTFPANVATVDLTVAPFGDGPEGSETAVLTLVSGAGYQLGSAASAEVTIADPPDPDPVVTVSAVDAAAMEPSPTAGGDSGTFRLTRTGSAAKLANALTVSFTLEGTATNGSDYATVQLTAAFAPNAATADVTVTPLIDFLREGSESVVLTLAGGAGYQVGSPSSALVTIADVPPPQVSITVPDSSANESGFNSAFFLVSRSGSLSLPLTVTVLFSGTASAPGTAGADYLVQGADNNNVNPITVTFPSGVSELMIRVIPHMDGVAEPDETVEFTVVDGDAYDLGPIFSGLITISGG